MARGKKLKQVPDSHPLAIHCEQHGVTAYYLICQHLRSGRVLGFFAIPPKPEEPAQAWCEACNRVLETERGWTDRADAQADWKLYCTRCYETTLARHKLQSWIRGTNPEDFE